LQKPIYKRELSHSYLIINDVLEETWNSYQYRMITRNRINGLLPCSERFIDGKTCLYYDISSRQSLAQIYEASGIGYIQIRGIIDNLTQVQYAMAEYLLEETCLILEPEYIYMDLETEQLFFLYYPLADSERKGRNTYLSLAEFFLEHVDHGEEKAVTAAYQFYKMSRAENFTIESFRAFLEKGRTEDSKRIRTSANELLFQEEEGIYEYRIRNRQESVEGINAEGIERKPDTDAEESFGQESWKQESEKPERFRISTNMIFTLAGMILTGGILAAICMVMWYVKLPESWRFAGYMMMAVDGLIFVLLIKKLISDTGKAESWKRKNRKDEVSNGTDKSSIREKENMIWESELWGQKEYDDTALSGPTVFVGESSGKLPGNGSGYEGYGRTPRLCYDSDENNREFLLDCLPLLVGKLKSKVQILLSDASVSRIHARFVEKNGQISLIDMNSTNGTFVNDIRLEQEEIMPLEDGDEIRFGNVKMKLQI